MRSTRPERRLDLQLTLEPGEFGREKRNDHHNHLSAFRFAPVRLAEGIRQV